MSLEPRTDPLSAVAFDLTAEQKALRDRARALAQTAIAPTAAETDRSEAYPWAAVAALTEAGFMGMTIPRAWGGQGRSYLDILPVIEELAKACTTTARICVEANMGAVGAIMRYGADSQKKLAAELVLAGDKPAICITEPDAGSAATEMTTRAERRGDVYVLNGTKHWITGGGVSRLHLLFARVIENGADRGIGGFIVVKDHAAGAPAGLRIGRRIPAMGVRGMPETEVHCEDLELPAEMLLLPPEGVRRGFAGLMAAYNGQRVGAGTVALGVAAGAYEQALAFVQRREQFGRPICEFQGLQWMLADMATQLSAAQTLLYRAAASADWPGGTGFPDQALAAQAKLFASETAVKVTNDALQLHGAAGYGRDLPLERMVRDARMFTIGGGTAQVLRTAIASKILDRKLPQTRDGFSKLAADQAPGAMAAE